MKSVLIDSFKGNDFQQKKSKGEQGGYQGQGQIRKESAEEITGGVLHRKIHWKTPVWESPFNKVARLSLQY